MKDDFSTHSVGLTTPAIVAEAIVPDDAADLGFATRALYVGETGDVRARLLSGAEVTFRNMQSGIVYPLRVRRVLATGTTATDLVGLG